MSNQLAVTEQPQNIIVLEQLPVITARLKELESEIDGKLQQAIALVVTPASKQIAKGLKSALNKEREAYEDIRKDIKAAILKPYDEFNAEYDRVIKSKYNAAEVELNKKIASIESAEIEKKTSEIKEFFAEYLQSKSIDFVDFDRAALKVNLTVTLTALKKSAKEWIDRIADDLALIDTQEHKAEILVEYKQSLDCSRSITMVTARHKAIEDERLRDIRVAQARAAEIISVEKVEAVIAEPISSPVAIPIVKTYLMDENMPRVLTFKVTATIEKLKALKQFLNDGGYQYE